MSAIIKKQYETAKQLLKSADYHFYYYENIDRSDKNFDKFFSTVTSLLTIIGGVEVAYSRVLQEDRNNGLNIVDNYRQKFAEYEAELKALGLIDNKPKFKNEDLYTLERIDRMQEERDAMYFERGYDYGC